MKQKSISLTLLKKYLASRLFDRPIYSNFMVSGNCNLRCKMCNYWKDNREELGTDEAVEVIDKLDEVGVGFINFTGGEPMLRDDLPELISYASNKGIFTSIISNGTLSNEKYKRVIEAGVKRIGISLDTMDEEKFDSISGVEGTWKKVIETLKFLSDYTDKIVVDINAVLSSETIGDFEDLIQFGKKIGADVDFTVINTGNEENTVASETDMLSEDHTEEEIRNFFENLKEKHDIFFPESYLDFCSSAFMGDNNWDCKGKAFMSVMSDGKVGICQEEVLEGLNILHDDFVDRFLSMDGKREELAESCDGCSYDCYWKVQKICSSTPFTIKFLSRRAKELALK